MDEAGYALRDAVLTTCDIARPYLRRVQDAMFPDPSRMNMKKRLTTRDVSRPMANIVAGLCSRLACARGWILLEAGFFALLRWLTVAPVGVDCAARGHV